MKEFFLLTPEIILALTLAFVIAAEITYHGERVRLVAATAVIGLAGAFVQTLLIYQYGAAQIFGRALAIDGLSLFFKLLFIALSALAIIISTQTQEVLKNKRTEYYALIVASCLAMCLAASAADLLLVFLVLQFMNVLGYFLAGYGKSSVLSTEAAVKYMVFGVVSAAFLLYGSALLFASTHSLNIYEIHKVLSHAPLARENALVVFMLLFLSISFQFAAFPMHLWAPDVLEGAPTPISSFLSLGSRATGFAVAIRILVVAFAQPAPELQSQWQVLGELDWTPIVALISVLTMLTGALLALRQESAKRMIGCLVVAETGYLLMGFLVLDEVGIAALLYNLIIELFALSGSYYILSFFHDQMGSDKLQDLRGMLGKAVPECICLVIFVLSLVGIPPTPGYLGKFTLIGSALRHHWPSLAVVAILSMAISTIAVARLAYHLVGDFKKVSAPRFVMTVERNVFLLSLVVPIFLAGIFAERVLDLAGKSLGFIFW